MPADVADLIGKLDFVQRETGTYFFVPAEFSVADIENLARAEHLLNGDQVVASWNNMSVRLTLPDDVDFPPADMGDDFAFMLEARLRLAGG